MTNEDGEIVIGVLLIPLTVKMFPFLIRKGNAQLWLKYTCDREQSMKFSTYNK